MRPTLLFTGLLALGVPIRTEAGPPPSWTVFADCAAAYQANARIADPGRPASMTAQVSDVAIDYRKAAERAYRHRSGGATRSANTVPARIAHQTAIYGARPREEVERVIDACPQVGG